MNFFLLLSFCLCRASMQVNFNTTRQIPSTNTSISSNTKQFVLEITQPVNPPSFSAFIYFRNITNGIIYQMDVHVNTTNVTYVNSTLTINTLGFSASDEFYITFDAGVLFSNGLNSTAETDPNFWHLKVVDIQTSISVTNTIPYTSVGTTQQVTIQISTASFTGTTMMYTTQNVNTTTTTNVTMVTMITGEPPPTRSAQIGMGLGITFISLLIIIEIIYFKFCHNSDGRSSSYFT